MAIQDKGAIKITKVILLLTVLGSILAYLYLILSPKPTLISFIPSSAQIRALVLDMNADNKLGLATVLNGQDAILVLHTEDTRMNHQKDIIESQLVLNQFDRNRDGTIDANDAVYAKLELMVYEGTVKDLAIRYVPIALTGIRTINIDPKYLSLEARQRSSQLPHPVAAVIMSDGSIRAIRDSMIDERYLTISPNAHN